MTQSRTLLNTEEDCLNGLEVCLILLSPFSGSELQGNFRGHEHRTRKLVGARVSQGSRAQLHAHTCERGWPSFATDTRAAHDVSLSAEWTVTLDVSTSGVSDPSRGEADSCGP